MGEQTTTQARATAPAVRPPGGLLQRACACGQHTPGGGECASCKQKWLQRSATGAGPAEITPMSIADSAYSFGHDLSNIPLRSNHHSGRQQSSASTEILLPLPTTERNRLLRPQAKYLVDSLGMGRPLDPAIQRRVAPISPYPLDGVRVHDDPTSHATAALMGNAGFTFGQHIVLGHGATGSQQDWLLAHELAHTLQQHPQNDRRGSSQVEAEANRFADTVLSPAHQIGAQPALGHADVGVAERVIARWTQDLPGDLLLITDVDDGDFVGGCVRAIVPHVGVKLIMKGVPKPHNQVFNVHIGFMTNARGERCVFFYESVSRLCQMRCFSSWEELREAWDEIKQWIQDLIEQVLQALAIAALVVFAAVLAYLIAQAIVAALAALLLVLA